MDVFVLTQLRASGLDSGTIKNQILFFTLFCVNQTLQTAPLYLVARDVTIAAFEFFNPINGNTRLWLKMQLKKQGIVSFNLLFDLSL